MSYSFTVRGADKAAVALLVTAELDKVVASQTVHKADRNQAEAAAIAFIGVLPDDDTQDIQVSMNGSVSWSGLDDAQLVTSAQVSVSASHVKRA
ncbi:MAG TPA: hypothetical protein VJO99_25905 [Burkholderiaceae bacterium]|nr:hypothetical protein [Burkholderiaceae bacterium]